MTFRPALVRFSVIASLAIVFGAPSGAAAGGGTLNVDTNVPVQGLDKGDLVLNFQFDFFPTQEQIESTMEKIEVARARLCDMTDGQVRIRRVNFTTGTFGATGADVRLLDVDHRASAGDSIFLFGSDCVAPTCNDPWFPSATLRGRLSGWDGSVLAHELGHYVVRLGDSYDEQRRSLSGCGVGPSFDAPDFSTTGIDNTIMQTSGYRCRDADDRVHSDEDPLHWLARSCRPDVDTDGNGVNDDCQTFTVGGAGGGGYLNCEPGMTELSWHDNHDQIAGPLGAVSCPAPVPASYAKLTATLHPTQSSTRPACGNGVVEAGEECDGDPPTDCSVAVPSGGYQSGRDASCAFDCRWATSNCLRVGDTCLNNMLDPGEECDPTAGIPAGDMGSFFVTCGLLAGNFDLSTAACRYDTCVYDRSSCLFDRGFFSCTGGPSATLDPGEECDGDEFGGLTCASFTGVEDGVLDCFPPGDGVNPPGGCWIDTSGCYARCGNGAIDGGEECDGTNLDGQDCGSLGFTAGQGTLSCDPQCRFMTSQCLPANVTFDDDSFDAALSTGDDPATTEIEPRSVIPSVGHLVLDVYDAFGLTGGWPALPQEPWFNDSIHKLHVYMSRVNRIDFMLIFAVDAGEYQGTEEEFKEVARFNLRFSDATTPWELVQINGVDVDAAGQSMATGDLPRIVLGGSEGHFVPWGTDTHGAEGQTKDTGAFTPVLGFSAPEVVLDLLLGDLVVGTWMREDGSNSWFSSYHFGSDQGTRVFSEIAKCDPSDPSTCDLDNPVECDPTDPGSCRAQRGNCNVPNMCSLSWDADRDRFEMAHHTFSQLQAFATVSVDNVRNSNDWFVADDRMPDRWRVLDAIQPMGCSYSGNPPDTHRCIIDAECPGGVCVPKYMGFDLQGDPVDDRADPSAPFAGESPSNPACDDDAKPIEYGPAPDAPGIYAQLGLPDDIMIVMDHSGSMAYDVDTFTDTTRIELARSAALTTVDTLYGGGRELGLVSFAGTTPALPFCPKDGEGTDTVDERVPLAPPGNGTGETTRAMWEDAVEAVEPVVDPQGTAICAGLYEARDRLLANVGGTKGILLLTDGENNRPCGTCSAGHEPVNYAGQCFDDFGCDGFPGSCEGTCRPEITSREIFNQGIRVVLVPTGGAAAAQAVGMAAASDGLVIAAPEADSLPAAFFEASIHFQGDSPSLTRTDDYASNAFEPSGVPHQIEVEVGAQRLDVHVSTRAPLAGQPQVAVADWDPRVFVADTGGSLIVDTAAPLPAGVEVVSEQHYKLIKIDEPAAGTWVVYTLTPFSGAPEQLSYVAAQVEHAQGESVPGCTARATPPFTSTTEPVRIEAQALYGQPIFEGVTFSGEVRVPGAAPVELTFTTDDNGLGVAEFDPADLTSLGLYEIVVHCDVAGGATFHPGEALIVQEGESNDDSLDAGIPPFTREARGFFFAAGAPYPEPPPGLDGPNDDADNDCILNMDEPAGDTDHDGLPDILDSDGDGDDVHDCDDLDASDPTVGDTPAGSTSQCGDVSGLAASLWPMHRTCPTHPGASATTGPLLGSIVWQKSLGGWVGSSPVLGADGHIYVGSTSNKLYALDANGAILWSYLTAGDVDSTPAVTSSGLVIFGSDDDKVRAVNADTGMLVWSFDTDLNVDSSPAVSGDVVYIGSDSNKLYALDVTTGDELWHYATLGDINSSPAVMPDGTIVFGSDDDHVYRLKPDLGLSQSQRLIWKRSLHGLDVESSPAIGPGPDYPIYVGGESNRFYKLDSATGDILWDYWAWLDVDSSPAIAPDGSIVFGSDTGVVTALNPDGTLKWDYDTYGPIKSSPAVSAQGVVYVGSNDNYLYALRGDEGLSDEERLLFKVYLGGDVKSSPAIAAGVVYVGSDQGKLFAIGAPPPGTPPAYNCTEKSHAGKSYWFCTSGLSWDSARNACHGIGYDLATVQAPAEEAFIEANVVADTWLGGSDKDAEEDWRWVFSDTLFWQGDEDGDPAPGAYTNFKAGQPDNFFNQDCLSLDKSQNAWTDENCSYARDYVCEDVPEVLGWRAQVNEAPATQNAFGCGVATGTRTGVGWGVALLIGLGLALASRRRRR